MLLNMVHGSYLQNPVKQLPTDGWSIKLLSYTY